MLSIGTNLLSTMII